MNEKLILKVDIRRRIDARGEAWFEAEIKVNTCSGILTGCVFTEDGIREVLRIPESMLLVNKEDETYKNYLVLKDKTLEALEKEVSEAIKTVKHNREKVRKHIALIQDYSRVYEVEI